MREPPRYRCCLGCILLKMAAISLLTGSRSATCATSSSRRTRRCKSTARRGTIFCLKKGDILGIFSRISGIFEGIVGRDGMPGGRAEAIMCSYASFDGIPSCAWVSSDPSHCTWGVERRGGDLPSWPSCRLFLGPGFRLGDRWNRLVETVKTRKKREKTEQKWARYGQKGVKEGS